jgi:hypothetical protein
MEINYVVEKLKEWDFKTNSKKSFSETYNISIRTIDRYINKYNIDYEKRQFGVKLNRNKNGQFVGSAAYILAEKRAHECVSGEPLKPVLTEKRSHIPLMNKGALVPAQRDASHTAGTCKARSFADMNKKYKHLFP